MSTPINMVWWQTKPCCPSSSPGCPNDILNRSSLSYLDKAVLEFFFCGGPLTSFQRLRSYSWWDLMNQILVWCCDGQYIKHFVCAVYCCCWGTQAWNAETVVIAFRLLKAT
jgi:hypothetical protein